MIQTREQLQAKIPKFSSLIRLIIEGLEEAPFTVNMATFGMFVMTDDKSVCYGCAATAALFKLSGAKLETNNLSIDELRDKYFDFEKKSIIHRVDCHIIDRFESHINALRSKIYHHHFEEFFGFKYIEAPDYVYDLTTTNWKEELSNWKEWLKELEEQGL